MTENLFFGDNKDKIKEKSLTKSKYFQFIDRNLVESQVISYNGTIIPLPKDWSYKKVKVLFNDGNSQEIYVKDNGNISYITVAKIYLGTRALISLMSEEESNNNNNSLIKKTLGKFAISGVYLTLAIYLFIIVPL